MFRFLGPGQLLFAAGLAGLGVLSLMHHDFALQWQPVPPGVPAREWLALASGGLLLLAAASLFFARTARVAALVLGLFFLSWVVLLQLPRLVAQPLSIAVWLGLCESLTLTVGAFVLYAWLDTLRRPCAGRSPPPPRRWAMQGCCSARRWWSSACPISPTRTSPPR